MGAIALLVISGAGPASASASESESGPAPAPGPPIPHPEPGEPLTEEDVNAWLDGQIPAALEDAGIAGASVSVVHDGEILTSRGYGYSDVEEREKVDPDETLFRMASISKTFTATAVMKLVEEGQIDLDTDVNEYLDFPMETSFDEPVTMRHLLTHTAGFEEEYRNVILPPDTDVELRDVVATEDPPEQVYEPGTTPSYSNHGYALAGYIVENVSGMSFEEYVAQNVFEPAGMDSSTFEQPLPEELESRLSKGYATADQAPSPFETVNDFPAGAVTSSATDMGRYMLAHLGHTQNSELLQPDTLSLMKEPATSSDTLGTLAEGPQMTLGFFQEGRSDLGMVGHGGDTMVFHSQMNLLPEQDTGFFISLNSSGHQATDSLNLRSSLMEGFTSRYFPASGEKDTEVEPTAAEHAAVAEGTYVSARRPGSTFMSASEPLDSEMQITAREDGTIVANPGPETFHPTEYEEIAPWVWREVDGHRMLTMRVVDGEVEAIGYASAFTMLPVEPERHSSVVLPIFVSSLVVLIVTLISWLVGPIVRRTLSLPKRAPEGRWARVLTRVGVGSAVLALAGWTSAILMISGLTDVPTVLLRMIQALQVVGILGVIPAAVALFNDIRHRTGWKRYVGSALVLLALLGIAWCAVVLNLVADTVSY
ncbi:CubicO group peptidase (beta-lactamase class C family) [Lipingzhangella halophila]|uniref:CubicO group peptidase (Beta-lactamase class C family) n=1 Tax=Lipingzhangella halophila TaxID=1783352 RepID=A0A7W7W188_9ACTN|nr:serine hydrolase domain-containing protein [Lipingzhangella halophila]MBB4929504.1 CubicO group peptidase (beta-lactamase class C family) [Lipingzhangella halophila]